MKACNEGRHGVQTMGWEGEDFFWGMGFWVGVGQWVWGRGWWVLFDLTRKYLGLRRGHAAWGLLCSRRAPLVLGCLKVLFEEESELLQEDVVQRLGEVFVEYGEVEEFEIKVEEAYLQGRRELREWIRRGLVVEREGKISSTDALQRAMFFVEGLDEQVMSSTASRLAVVQREIEALEAALNPAKEQRIEYLKRKIGDLEDELKRAEAGEFEVLEGARAVEGIREVYQLAMGLKADFRRVEDSYRAADRKLRQQITRSDQSRSAVLDGLLDAHDELLATAEGQVFDGFYEQLQNPVPLDEMKRRLRELMQQPCALEALNRKQRNELQWLVASLLRESQRVIEARARGEQDVKSYVKTGLASENFRVGLLVNELLEVAVDLDWEAARVRRLPANLPPLGMQVRNLPLIERLVTHQLEAVEHGALDLSEGGVSLAGLDDEFWLSLRGLDRQALLARTLERLEAEGRPMRLVELSDLCEAEYDLETVVFWLGLYGETGAEWGGERETLRVIGANGGVEFEVPRVWLEAAAVKSVDLENLG